MSNFKVGDKVIIKDIEYYNNHLKNFCKLNDVLTINSIDYGKSGYGMIMVNNGAFGAYDIRFRPANTQIIKKRLGII